MKARKDLDKSENQAKQLEMRQMEIGLGMAGENPNPGGEAVDLDDEGIGETAEGSGETAVVSAEKPKKLGQGAEDPIMQMVERLTTNRIECVRKRSRDRKAKRLPPIMQL